jgi:hypothetical protein
MKLTAALLATLLGLGAASATPKSYAVFLATLDPATGQAVGGVAGSAFFISPTQAITAFHVLQPKSFENPHTQVWLVHEDEPAIELSREELRSQASLDRTTIALSQARVPQRHVFTRASDKGPALTVGTKVETDGFIANSAGPVLALAGLRLRITSVPRLERLHAEGSVLRNVRVELASNDVNLKNAPCVQVSYKPVVGLSGGPVVSGGQVVGMNSFGLNEEAHASTWAVDLSQN